MSFPVTVPCATKPSSPSSVACPAGRCSFFDLLRAFPLGFLEGKPGFHLLLNLSYYEFLIRFSKCASNEPALPRKFRLQGDPAELKDLLYECLCHFRRRRLHRFQLGQTRGIAQSLRPHHSRRRPPTFATAAGADRIRVLRRSETRRHRRRQTRLKLFNFAAVHREPGHAREEYFDTNIAGAKNVCAFAEETGCKNILFTSSIAVYGALTKSRSQNRPALSLLSPYLRHQQIMRGIDS